MNGDPRSSLSSTGIPTRSAGANEVLRSKNKRRDDQIRKKVEQELSKRTKQRNTINPGKDSRRGTVSSLKPAPAIIIIETAKIIQAAQLMAAKRIDAVLVVSEQGDLVGILTDKDIAFRVVAEGLDVRTTVVSDVMTADPIAVYDKGSRNEALNIMVSRRFRHLPVISDGDDEEGQSVVGLLDITKCVFERLDDLERKVNEDQSIISAMDVLERRGTVNSDRIDTLRNEHECPDVASVIAKVNQEFGDFPGVSVKSSVRDAAKAMKSYHGTAVLVTGTPDGEGKVAGIFTTKDIVLRVIAASLDPSTTSVIRVMISKSGFAAEQGEEGPMWNSFWNSTFAHSQVESDRVSQVSDSRLSSTYSRSQALDKSLELSRSQLLEKQALRSEGIMSPEPSSRYSLAGEDSFSFKLKDMTSKSGKIYRFSCPVDSLEKVYENVCAKTGYKHEYKTNDSNSLDIVASSGVRARLCYLDEDGDIVGLENDKDVYEAVQMAISLHSNRLMIYLGDPPSNTNPLLSKPNSVRSASPNLRSSSPYPLQTKQSAEAPHTIFDTLKEAPLPVNVALSAGIVVVAFYMITKIARIK
ncbi:hypothetical protein HK103_006619 [Boothiomyces macroporosus]|uniref:CBS domain-containing protein n=1 Tax=Boothiomyces macroporosus TaxID=261099 RepID=A0AAD5UGP5_9FUNG|nr:hypothetical protein HK103_006619 [Boothiomyces macroporosus]